MTPLRLISDEGYGARGNVALTAAMAELHAAGKIPDTLRLYRYPESVLLGCNQDASAAADLDTCNRHGIEIARRVTGGGAIYMDRGVLTWDLVIAGRAVGADPRALSAKVCRAIAGGLAQLGVAARFLPDNAIEAGGKKIAGASGYAGGPSLVHQGSLMLAPDLQKMASVLRMAAVEQDVTTVSALAGREVGHEEASLLLAQSISSALGRDTVSGALSPQEQALRQELFAQEFGRDDFVFGADFSDLASAGRAAA